MNFQRAQKLMLRRIERQFPASSWRGRESAFEVLVGTILSQHTNDRNSERAMRDLKKVYRISPRSLAKASLSRLMRCVYAAGLYRDKARHIRDVSRILLKRYGGSLWPILRKRTEEAREELMELPGVGYKTADILLTFVKGSPVIPVDTHIMRVTKRLGITTSNAHYENVRNSLEQLVPPKKRMPCHISLITFGRKICKATRPSCPRCPVNDLCPSAFKF